MYPILRFAKGLAKARTEGKLGLFEEHRSQHLCWPWDIDPWMELNNGRTLTLYDLGRIPMAVRTGLTPVLRQNRWGLTVAGSVVRYRRRIRMFDRFETRSRLIGWDHRFLYTEQSMWRPDGTCTSHALFRNAVTDAKGIVAPERLAAAMGHDQTSPLLPGWVTAWIDAESQRPWPPMQDTA